jgi:hypothetical protein
MVSSASPPTLSSHKVATATASHRRAARSGWVMWVRCHCQPARLVILKLPIRSIDFYYPEFQAANALIVRDKSKICFLEGLK